MHPILTRLIIGCAFFMLWFSSGAQVVVPAPAEIRMEEGTFVLTENTQVILLGDGMERSADFLKNYVRDKYGLNLTVSNNKRASTGSICFTYRKMKHPVPGAYQLTIKPGSITLDAENEEGLFYGVQTLLQLLPAENSKRLAIPAASIKDKPRFPYRGMHLDVARHFFPVAYIKKYIDLLAYHKFNKFHWHLTDDQGWRIEIKKFPLLTVVGSCRDQTLVGRFGSDVYDGKKYCGFYTQEEIRDVVKYAADRYIEVIPEIDIPGHSLAALAAYPYLGCTKGPYRVRETWAVQPDVFCAGNDSTYSFVFGVFDEVLELFPSKYIHIGGDESPKERWKACPVCQQRIRTSQLKNEQELQSYFVKRVEKYLSDRGRKAIGWDEILEGGLAPGAVVMSWRGMGGGIAAAKSFHEVIMTPEDPLYLNLSQTKNEDSLTQGGYNPLEKVYRFDPVPPALTDKEATYVTGMQGNIWTEYISNPSKLEYMAFPRMSALAEAAWTPVKSKSWEEFEKKLPALFKRYDWWNVNYSTAYYDIQPAVIPVDGKISWKLESRSPYKIVYRKDSTSGEIYPYSYPLVIDQSGTWGAALVDDTHGVKGNWVNQEFRLNKASGKKVTLTYEPNSKYAGQGGFTLVDGIQNTRGMLKASQFLGFIGKDLEAIVDLGESTEINAIILHCFEQQPSWIYRPQSVEFSYSQDGNSFFKLAEPGKTGVKNLSYRADHKTSARYLKIKAINYGIIPAGFPGAGTKAWLFADEIEIY